MAQNYLTSQFDEQMLGIYQRALVEAHYNASYFLQMLQDYGGLETARKLIHSRTVSKGYTVLWELKRLDLTVEALIHDNPKWYPLFTTDELNICEQRLKDYGYFP